MPPDVYRTRDGVGRYTFSYEQVGSSWHSVILKQPDYGARGRSLHDTHRLTPGGRHIVCWDPLPSTLETAVDVSRLWADCTQVYLASGTFGSPSTIPATPLRPRSDDEDEYVTVDRTATYRFRYLRSGVAFRIKIMAQPPYAGRSHGGQDTHRVGVSDSIGFPFVGWVPAPRTVSEAMKVARHWAEGTQAYLRTGVFPVQASSRSRRAPISAAQTSSPGLLDRIRDRIG